MRVWVWVVLVAIAAGPAHADRADDLRAEGEDLARRGEYAPAIEKFKAADRLRPRALHACMIGLTFLRRQLWLQAEIYLERCRRRATAADPVPAWMADAESQLAKALAGAPVTRVDIVVAPPGVAALVKVSALPDDPFDPQVVHLPEGDHVIEISAPGFTTVTNRLELRGRGDRRLAVKLEPVSAVTGGPLIPRRDPGKQRWSNRLLIGSGIAAAGGVVFHVLASRTRDKLVAAETVAAFREHEGTFDWQRATAVSLYGVAAIAAGIGIYLRVSHREVPVQVSGSVTGDAALVTIGWTR